jgi:hypothetical protein
MTGLVLISAFTMLLVSIPHPMKKASVPTHLTQFEQDIAAFYHYDLGGFIDSEELWRIEASPTNSVPPTFYAMSPIGWPDALPPGGEAFQSTGFVGDDRGHDGMHYFLLHDKQQGKAFVWVKQNF